MVLKSLNFNIKLKAVIISDYQCIRQVSCLYYKAKRRICHIKAKNKIMT